MDAKRQLIEPGPPWIAVRRPCERVGLSRSGRYDEPPWASAATLLLLRLLDDQDTRTPDDGLRRMTARLRRRGSQVNHTRVQRLLRLMGLEAIDPKPRRSQLGTGQQVSPDLRHGVHSARVNQVWSTASTGMRLRHGCGYLVALLDGLSRYVVAWDVSVTLDRDVCSSALERALVHAQPEMFNSAQGVPFTSAALTERLNARGIPIRLDGRGRARDNIFVERLWRTRK